MNERLPVRKAFRLKEYDYRMSGAYFVTLCTKDRQMLFSPVGADSISARMVMRVFAETIARYPGVDAPIFVVMPNHFHAIITIERADMESEERADIESAPTVPKIMQSFKRYSTLEYIKLVKQGILPPFAKQIWQRSYYDHVIRNQQDYDEIYRYIEENPLRWQLDTYYSK